MRVKRQSILQTAIIVFCSASFLACGSYDPDELAMATYDPETSAATEITDSDLIDTSEGINPSAPSIADPGTTEDAPPDGSVDFQPQEQLPITCSTTASDSTASPYSLSSPLEECNP